MRTGDDWTACHAELERVCEIFNTKVGLRAKAAITQTDGGLGTARVVVDYTGGTAQLETTLERRARQDLEAGFGSAGFVYEAIEEGPDHRAWDLELAATSDVTPVQSTTN